MQERDRPKFVELMQALAASFRVDPSPALFEGYWLGLQGLDIEAVGKAIGNAIGSSKRMPVPAELREFAGDVPVAMLAVQAWAKLRQTCARVGVYRSVDFGPVMNATIRTMGGWEQFCKQENDEWVRKDFEKTYCAFAAMGVPDDQGRYLAGLVEVSNSAGGFDFDPPVVIEGVPNVPNKRVTNGSTETRRFIEAMIDHPEKRT